jgi:hypothetical protein
VRRRLARIAAAAIVLAGAVPLFAAETQLLGPCRPDAHDGPICGTGDGAARVIADTTSPSQRLALAWRSTRGPPTEEPDDDDIELVLIRLSDGAVLSSQRGSFWDTGEMHANRRDERAAWSANSRLVVERYDSRFSTDSMTVYAIGADDKASTLGLLEIVEPAVRAQLRRAVKNDEPYSFLIRRLRIDNGGTIRTTVIMWVPKDGPSVAFDLTVAVARTGGTLAARITSMRRTREKL